MTCTFTPFFFLEFDTYWMFLFCSLAAQREQFIRDKQEQQDMYKNALEAQVGGQPRPVIGSSSYL